MNYNENLNSQPNKDSTSARTPQDKELIKRQIDSTDKQIDALFMNCMIYLRMR